jgi:hypothetical protein
VDTWEINQTAGHQSLARTNPATARIVDAVGALNRSNFLMTTKAR